MQGKDYTRLPLESNGEFIDADARHRRQSSRKCSIAAIFVIALAGLFSLTALTIPAWHPQRHRQSETNLSMILSPSIDSDFIPSRMKFEKTAVFNASIIGSNLMKIDMPMSQMVTPADGQDLSGKAFNLALMRLPSGAQWEYMAVTRGPKKYRLGETVKNHKASAMVSSVLGFGVNMTSKGRLVPVSKATFLYVRTVVSQGCQASGDNEWSGPEDARLYWSDSATPMMTVGIPSTLTLKQCKGIALVQDLRSVWPELAVVLAPAHLNVKPYVAGVEHYEMLEVIKEKQRNGEKNWMPFFPGALPSIDLILPNFIYTASPSVALTPPKDSSLDHSSYLPLAHYSDQNAEQSSTQCLDHVFPTMGKGQHHGATPLYRLTLCNRGECQPNNNNTYLLSLTHLLRSDNDVNHHTYSRYASLRSVEPPHNLIAVGPPLQFAGTNDSDIVYAVSLTFKPSSKKADVSTAYLGPIHGFLDDEVIVGLGLVDDTLAALNVSLKGDLLSSMVLCSTMKLTN